MEGACRVVVRKKVLGLVRCDGVMAAMWPLGEMWMSWGVLGVAEVGRRTEVIRVRCWGGLRWREEGEEGEDGRTVGVGLVSEAEDPEGG